MEGFSSVSGYGILAPSHRSQFIGNGITGVIPATTTKYQDPLGSWCWTGPPGPARAHLTLSRIQPAQACGRTTSSVPLPAVMAPPQLHNQMGSGTVASVPGRAVRRTHAQLLLCTT
jgi:hypothetical protein